MYDVIIVGGGVIGCAVARFLSQFELRICVLESKSDVAEGASKANSGIVHAGFDAEQGSKKAFLNVAGAKMMPHLSKELDFSYKNNGAMVIAFSSDGIKTLSDLLNRGKANGVEGLKILNKKDVLEKEPNVNSEVVAALHVPTGGIVCPYGLTIALAENAADNGVEFFFESHVNEIQSATNGFTVSVNGKSFLTKWVVNAAGLNSDIVNNMVNKKKLKLTPRKGEYQLFDSAYKNVCSHTLFQLPTKAGKGVLVTTTTHGNLLIGPNAIDVDDKTNFSTTADGLNDIAEKAKLTVPALDMRQVITQFAGIRAHLQDDFLIEESSPCFFNLVGIESPGLTAAPAIGEFTANYIAKKLNAKLKTSWNPIRRGQVRLSSLALEKREKLIRQNPLYGRVVCRCESVTHGEIVDSIRRTLGAKTLDGVKKRTRLGMGRCQSGFCCPAAVEILAEQLGICLEDVTKSGEGSNLLLKEKPDEKN